MKERVIWTAYPDIEDWRDYLMEEYPDLRQDDLYEKMYEVNAEYLVDERANLNIDVGAPIVVIADLGLWNGRVPACAIIRSGKISGCLYSEYDATWYVDEHGDLRCRAVHHDGTNYHLYRRVKPTVSEDDIDEFMAKVIDGEYTSEDVEHLTEPLYPYIARVYGWEEV